MSAQSQPRGSWLGHFSHVIVGKGVLNVYIMTGRDGKSCKISFSSGDPFAASQSPMNTMFHCVLTCNCVFTRGQRHIEVLSNFDDLLTTLDPYRLTTALTLIKHAIKQLSGGFTRCQQAWWEGFLECHCETKVHKRVSDRVLMFVLSDLTNWMALQPLVLHPALKCISAYVPIDNMWSISLPCSKYK